MRRTDFSLPCRKMKMDRLDKIISRQLNITRSQARELIKSGAVQVNDMSVTKCDAKFGDGDAFTVDGRDIGNEKFVYIMMNKPKGVISASDGKGEKTVVDILPENMKRRGLFPAGRLDKDTTGFVLITDDGTLAHDILSPKNHIDKTYIACLDKPCDEDTVRDFRRGMTLNGEKLIEAEIAPVNKDYTVAKVVLRQGLYHQVKRMFKKHGITVTELKRIAMGDVELDSALGEGECRYLTKNEINLLKK